jgi:hypothetical protein
MMFKRRYRVVAEIDTDDPRVAREITTKFKVICGELVAPHGVKVVVQTSDGIKDQIHMERPWGE